MDNSTPLWVDMPRQGQEEDSEGVCQEAMAR